MFIYKITHVESGKAYIGQTTVSVRKRWLEHCRKASRCILLASAIQKYGRDSFTLEVIHEAKSLDELNRLEFEFIKAFNTLYPNGYNLREGGDNSLLTQEVKDKLSKIKLGKKFSPAHRKALSEARVGMTLSEDHKRAIALSCGSGASHKDYGKTLSAEHRQKVSDTRIRKAVQCVETGTVYESVSAAAKALDVSRKTILRRIKSAKLRPISRMRR